MHQARTDSALIDSSLEDPAVFGDIFERHYDSISLFLRRRVDESLADELAGQTFLQAFKSRAAFDTDRDSAKPWLLAIANNLIRHEARARKRKLRAYERLDRDHQPDFSAETNTRLDAESRRADLVSALEQLTSDELEALTLQAWEGLSYAEIAEVLQTPIGTVRSRLSRARARMTEQLFESEPRTAGVNANGY